MGVKTIFKPTKNHILEIEKWLLEEQSKTGDGFYCDLNTITSAFKSSKIAILIKDNYAIGFITYQIYGLIAKIDIAEIEPSFRKKGLGRKMVNDCLDNFKNKGILVTELYCAPKSSELIWKGLDFFNFPILPHDNGKIRMYKPLVCRLETKETNQIDEVIELWDYGTHVNEQIRPPKWVWNINSSKLKNPIIQPAFYDWQIRWRKGNKIIESCKVKNFDSIASKNCGDFVIIKELKKTDELQ